ncbi:protein EVI2B [Dasypus novemcinctus]|uniref:protein EVI2B n=1 Tax=Dasypus novemcinctus TaxID=9361 RepID=UPI00265E8A26|nr:protein EVI2B [Dasypus novemcinctus]
MDPKYFIFIFFCGHLNDTFFSETEAITTEKQPLSTLFGSKSDVSVNTTGHPLGQPTQHNNTSTGQSTPPAEVNAGHPFPDNITRQPVPTVSASFITSARKLPPSAHNSTSQQPQPPVYTSTQQPSLSIHTSSGKPIPLTVINLPTQPRSTVKNSPRITPGFILETTSTKKTPQKTNSNSTAAILIGVILTSMLVAIIVIVLWKCLRKPVLNDQNWAGRSPFADGETPDICLDNIRENEVPVKRTSIVSLMAWKPSKSTVSADDLEIKLFESSENIEESNNPKTEKIKDQVNGTSEESAGGSTIGTAISSSDDADLPPPPPLLDLEEQENKQSDKPTMTILTPPPVDSTDLPPYLDCLSKSCEDHNSETKQSFLPPPDSFNLPPPPADFMKNQEDSTNEIQCQEFSIPSDSAQDLSESLPAPPAELL